MAETKPNPSSPANPLDTLRVRLNALREKSRNMIAEATALAEIANEAEQQLGSATALAPHDPARAAAHLEAAKVILKI
jgi:hypothetical protein